MSTETTKSFGPIRLESNYKAIVEYILNYLDSNPVLTPTITKIPKNSRGYRTLYIPQPEHKVALSRFLKLATYTYLKFGTVVEKTIVKNIKKDPRAIGHLFRGSNTGNLDKLSLISLDLKNAFESVSIDTVYERLLALSSIPKIPELFIKIITHTNFKDFVFYNNRIPTGYPTSNFLYEHAMISLEDRLTKLKVPEKYKDLLDANDLKLIKFRYVDDIKILITTTAVPFVGVIKNIIEELGFVINKKKISIKEFKEGWKVFNLSVSSSGRLKIPKKVRNKLRALNYRLKKSSNAEEKEAFERKIAGILGYYWPKNPISNLLSIGNIPTSVTCIK